MTDPFKEIVERAKWPLDEIDNTTPLDTFYARNPEELSDEDLEALVQMHREEREARATKKRATKKVKKA